jgi:hypothetical protein
MSSNCVSAPTGTGTARGSDDVSSNAGGVGGKGDSNERSGICIEDVAMTRADRRWAGHLRKREDRRDHHDGFAAVSGIASELDTVFTLMAVLTTGALQTIRPSRKQAQYSIRSAGKRSRVCQVGMGRRAGAR